MQQESDLAAFLDMTVAEAVKECASHMGSSVTSGMKAEDVMALLVFKFAAVTTRSIEAAAQAEADFRKRIAIAGDAANKTAH